MSRQQQSPSAAYDDDEDDIGWGLESLAITIGLDLPQVYYLVRHRKRNKIPVARHGHKTYSFSRRRVRAWCAGEELSD
jgi:hypothetical protein